VVVATTRPARRRYPGQPVGPVRPRAAVDGRCGHHASAVDLSSAVVGRDCSRLGQSSDRLARRRAPPGAQPDRTRRAAGSCPADL